MTGVPNGAPSDAAVQAAAEVLAHGEAAAAQMTPREQAEAAWESDEIATVNELETKIRLLREQARRREQGR